MKNIETQQNTQ